MRLEDCLKKVRGGAKLIHEGECVDVFTEKSLLGNLWSVEEQPKKIEELVEPSYWDSTTEPLDNKMHREKINEIIRELNGRGEK